MVQWYNVTLAKKQRNKVFSLIDSLHSLHRTSLQLETIWLTVEAITLALVPQGPEEIPGGHFHQNQQTQAKRKTVMLKTLSQKVGELKCGLAWLFSTLEQISVSIELECAMRTPYSRASKWAPT